MTDITAPETTAPKPRRLVNFLKTCAQSIGLMLLASTAYGLVAGIIITIVNLATN